MPTGHCRHEVPEGDRASCGPGSRNNFLKNPMDDHDFELIERQLVPHYRWRPRPPKLRVHSPSDHPSPIEGATLGRPPGPSGRGTAARRWNCHECGNQLAERAPATTQAAYRTHKRNGRPSRRPRWRLPMRLIRRWACKSQRHSAFLGGMTLSPQQQAAIQRQIKAHSRQMIGQRKERLIQCGFPNS